MKLCLAGTGRFQKTPDELKKSKYLLESFYSIEDWQIPYFKTRDFFLLDSGAFTFMNSQKGNVDFDAYLKRYAAFIKQHDFDHFFELDIDPIAGYEKVKEMRRILENETGKPCIPIWHKSRGLEDFLQTTKEYEYMAIGGIVTKEIAKTQWHYFKKLIDIAHSHHCKIHGLGFTATPELHKYPFDSVDSTTWINGGRFGNVCVIRDGIIVQDHDSSKRCVDPNGLTRFNFETWCEYQKYAEACL